MSVSCRMLNADFRCRKHIKQRFLDSGQDGCSVAGAHSDRVQLDSPIFATWNQRCGFHWVQLLEAAMISDSI